MKEGGGGLVLWPDTPGLHSGLGATAAGDGHLATGGELRGVH